jgi:hypothetical protein
MACGIHQLPFALKTHDQGSVVLGRYSSLSMGIFRMKKLILAVLLVCSSAVHADGLILVDPANGRYLGNVNSNPYDPNSISNPYGRYGSQYSPDSINNPYGQYGSPYSPNSVNNPYAVPSMTPVLIERY